MYSDYIVTIPRNDFFDESKRWQLLTIKWALVLKFKITIFWTKKRVYFSRLSLKTQFRTGFVLQFAGSEKVWKSWYYSTFLDI